MLRTIILGPHRELAEAIYAASTHCESFDIYGTYREYPPFERLIRIVNQKDPHVVLIEVDSTARAVVIMRDIRKTNPNVALVGYAAEDAKKIAPVEEFCEVIRSPFPPEKLEQAIVGAIEGNIADRCDNVCAFLPAKAGSGATLTAMNVAGALAHYWSQKVLVIEADLHSGYIGVALQFEPERTVMEALENAESLSESTWKHLIHRAQGVDWLLTARSKSARRIPPWEYQWLLTFVSPLYDTVIVDLPEVINEATETVVRRASNIFVVTTPEVPALYLARRRLGDLKSRGIADDQRTVVLNRFTEEEEVLRTYEDILGQPIGITIRSDYGDVQRAMFNAGLVSRASELEKGYFAIAKQIAPGEPVKSPPDEEHPKKPGDEMRRLLGAWVNRGNQP